MKYFGNFQQTYDQAIKLPIINKSNKRIRNQKLTHYESLKTSDDEPNLYSKTFLMNKSVNCSKDIILNLLREKPIYNKIYPKISLSKDKKRQKIKLNPNDIINYYGNAGNLDKKRNSPIRDIKLNSLITEINKSVSLKNANIYKDSKLNFMKTKYDLLNNKKRQKMKKVKTIKISPKVANIFVYSPGEWKKNRNCSLKYQFNRNQKSIDEADELLHDISGKLKATFAIFKKHAEKDFDDDRFY